MASWAENRDTWELSSPREPPFPGFEGQTARRGQVRWAAIPSSLPHPRSDTTGHRVAHSSERRSSPHWQRRAGGGPSLLPLQRPSHFHRVHFSRAPALDLAGPEQVAVVHAAAGEDPYEGRCSAGGPPGPCPSLLPLPQQGPPDTSTGTWQVERKDRQAERWPVALQPCRALSLLSS